MENSRIGGAAPADFVRSDFRALRAPAGLKFFKKVTKNKKVEVQRAKKKVSLSGK